jgi:hypothetical protein
VGGDVVLFPSGTLREQRRALAQPLVENGYARQPGDEGEMINFCLLLPFDYGLMTND